MDMSPHRSYFFDTGLYFECRKCGACCTGSPGIVRVKRDEIEKIARFLSVPVHEFMKKYIYSYGPGYSVREHPDGRCYFFDEKCLVYKVRPIQCRTFPFWFRHLRNEVNWKKISKECPGIGQGKHYTKEKIIDIVHNTLFDKDLETET